MKTSANKTEIKTSAWDKLVAFVADVTAIVGATYWFTIRGDNDDTAA